MSLGAKLNESDKIARAVPLLANLIFHSNPTTGQGFAATVQELLNLAVALAPSKTFATQAEMLADTTLPIGYIAYVADSQTSFLYQGPTHDNIANYAVLGGGGGGSIGETATAVWKFETAITSPPGATAVRFNNAVPASISEMYLAETSKDGKDVANFLEALNVGDVFYIQQKDDATKWIRVRTTGEAVDNGADWTLPIETVEASGTLPDADADTIVRATFGAGLPVTPGGPLGSVQFNDAGAFNGEAFFAYDKTTDTILIGVTKIKTPGTKNMFWGEDPNNAITTGAGNIGIGEACGKNINSGSSNVLIGLQAGNLITIGNGNICLGIFAGYSIVDGSHNVALGQASMFQANGQENVGIGTNTLKKSTGSHNIAIGQDALASLLLSGANIVLGGFAGQSLSAIGAEKNIVIGYASLPISEDSHSNVIIGAQSGTNTQQGSGNVLLGKGIPGPVNGHKNVAIGYQVDIENTNQNGQLSIQNAIFGKDNTGEFAVLSTGGIGIYVKVPTARLHLPAGLSTPGGAPLKIPNGVLLSITEEGALEHDVDLYFTTATGRHKLTGRLSPILCSPSGGTLTLDCANRQEVKFLCTSTLTGATSIVLGNAANLISLHLTLPITGTGIALTWPSSTRMARYNETPSGDGWNQTSKILTVSSVGADDLWEFSLMKMGSIYKINYDGPTRS